MDQFSKQKPEINISENTIKLQNNILNLTNGCPIFLNSAYPVVELISKCRFDPLTISSQLDSDSILYKNCLRTFKDDWPLNFITPSQMANTGLLFSSSPDRVRCIFCSIILDSWKPEDDPLFVHKTKAKKCPLFNKNQGYDIYIDDSNDNEIIKTIVHCLVSIGVLQQIRTPAHEEYISLESRLTSFEVCKKKLKQSFHSYSTAGFFYSGYGDSMSCFFCNQGMKNWEKDDEPWTEHAQWSPTCSYLLLCKGKNFVNEACGIKNYVLHKPIANINDVAMLENNTQLNSEKEIFHHLEVPRRYELMEEFSQTPEYDAVETLLRLSQNYFVETSYEENMQGTSFISSEMNAMDTLSDLSKPNLSDTSTELSEESSSLTSLESLESQNIECSTSSSRSNLSESSFESDENAMETSFESYESNVESSPALSAVISDASSEFSDENLSETFESTSNNLIKTSESSKVNLSPSQEDQNSILCKICYREEMRVAFIPCRHVIACVDCSFKLKSCAVCRQPYNSVLRILVSLDVQDHGPSSTSKFTKLFCKICHRVEMDAVFLPCGHVYACIKCATEMGDCPVCLEAFCATMQIYL